MQNKISPLISALAIAAASLVVVIFAVQTGNLDSPVLTEIISGRSNQTAVVIDSQIIPSDRLPLPGTWENAGVEGGIPLNRSTICADVTQAPYNADKTGNTSAVAAIQSAISACPNGQVVYVPSGTYLIDSGLRIQWQSITLRGAGPSTVFKVTGDRAVLIGGMGVWPPPKANPAYNMPITGGATRGSNTVSVADTSSIEVNKMIMVDEWICRQISSIFAYG